MRASLKLTDKTVPITILGYGDRGIIYAYEDDAVNTVPASSGLVTIDPGELNRPDPMAELATEAPNLQNRQMGKGHVIKCLTRPSAGSMLVW